MFGRKKKKKLFQEMRKTAEFDSMRDMDDDEVDQFYGNRWRRIVGNG